MLPATTGTSFAPRLVKHGVTQITTLAGAQAMAAGLEAMRANGLSAIALQDLPQHPLPLEGDSAQ